MSEADEIFEKLGYKQKQVDEYCITYTKIEEDDFGKSEFMIEFYNDNTFEKYDDTGEGRVITIPELKAINKFYEEKGLI